MELKGKRALVMGLGIHNGGLGVARFLAEQGAEVTVTDLRGPELLGPSIQALAGLPIRFVLGEHRDDDFRTTELVVRNPGVPHTSRYLEIARAAGVPIEMEMSLFFRLCRGPILGITGTKGKTTTTMLVGAMLKQQFPDAVVAGNLRVSALEQLPLISEHTPVGLELSSFALEGLGEAGLSPQYACITNISADHLDRYGTMQAYTEAKAQIWRHQHPDNVLVLNAGDPVTRAMADQVQSRVIWFGSAVQPRPGQAAMLARADGIWWQNGTVHERICGPEDIRLPGLHNQINIAAAAALAYSFGVEQQAIREAVRNFRGVPHRLEPVRMLGGVRYVNDTAATAPEAAIAALQSFQAPIILIAGGADKQLPFAELAQAMIRHARAVVLLAGTATPKLQAALAEQLQTGQKPAIYIYGPFDDFEQAIETAAAIAHVGEIVLLSPGCASFGMFRNEFHRGEEFRRIVGLLPGETYGTE